MHPQENNNQVPQRKTNVLNWLRTFQQNELLQKRELKVENDTCGWIILLGVLKCFHHLEICFWAFYLKQEVALCFSCLYHTNTLRYCKWACTWQLIHSPLGKCMAPKNVYTKDKQILAPGQVYSVWSGIRGFCSQA